MHAHAESKRENQPSDSLQAAPMPSARLGLAFVDNRPEAVAQLRLQAAINGSPRLRPHQALQARVATSSRYAKPADPTHAEEAGAEPPEPGKATKTGLPDQLKAGIESLSGHSLDDVRVHYNSAQPAQLQAHAYAQGSTIHLAPGQEQHLPHEAWHVVQQKQGRVKPTVQLKGQVAVNDDAGLEKEADVMGALALRQRLGPAAAGVAPLKRPAPVQRAARQLPAAVAQRQTSGAVFVELTPPPALDSAAVLQRIATQIRTQAAQSGQPVIAQVVVRGRPEAVYGNSMGDHTTAFIVHVEGLNVNLIGRTIPQALEFMDGLRTHLRELPGYQNMLLNVEDQRIRQRYQLAETRLITHLQEAAHTTNAQVQMHLLQEAIDAYLDARELIPFSTINVGEKSKGKAGKGHGESGPAGVLSNAEQSGRVNGQRGLDAKNIVAAIYGLFDFQSAGMAAVEVNKVRLSLLTQGVHFWDQPSGATVATAVKDPLLRLQMMWRQHCLTIQRLYPTVYGWVQPMLKEDHLTSAMNESIRQDFSYLCADADRYLKQLSGQFYDVKNEFGSKGLVSSSKIVLKRAKVMNAIYANQARIVAVIAEMHTLNDMLGKGFSQAIQMYEGQVQQYKSLQQELPHFNLNNASEREAMSSSVQEQIASAEQGRQENEGAVKPGAIKNLGELGSVGAVRPLKSYMEKIKAEDLEEGAKQKAGGSSQGAKVNSSGTETLSSQMQSMAIQVTLGATGLITGMLSAGRPDSPFLGTMGAHSTAWAAHLDRVRAAIRGQSVPAAYQALRALAVRVMGFYSAQQHKPLGANAKGLIENAGKQMTTQASRDGAQATLASLQDFIESILSFYNLIPDVSRDRIDTAGKGEGTYRARLLAYEATGAGSPESIQEAIAGMFDGRGRTGALWENHKQVISEAYPNSFNLVENKQRHPSPNSGVTAAVSARESEDGADEIKPLSQEQIENMKTAVSQDQRWLVSQNNCLINAIAEAAGATLPLPAQVIIAIRAEIGAELGTMLYATTPILDIIARHLHLPNGVVVVYQGSGYTDETTAVRGQANNPVYIFHDGVDHFSPLR